MEKGGFIVFFFIRRIPQAMKYFLKYMFCIKQDH